MSKAVCKISQNQWYYRGQQEFYLSPNDAQKIQVNKVFDGNNYGLCKENTSGWNGYIGMTL